jgi:hypothetical protein
MREEQGKESPQIYRAAIALLRNLKYRTMVVAALEFRPHVAARPLDLRQTFGPFEGTYHVVVSE